MLENEPVSAGPPSYTSTLNAPVCPANRVAKEPPAHPYVFVPYDPVDPKAEYPS
jgi:hypothetical protein